MLGRFSNLKLTSNYYYIITRTKCYWSHNYTKAVENAVNIQINAEQQAAQDYLSMANILLHPSLARPGAGGFFMRMYEEELGHMQDFIEYQIMRGGFVELAAPKQPAACSCLSLYDAFIRALEMERYVTTLLENLVKCAESNKDYQCADYVTSVYLAEQMKAINDISNHITKLSRLGANEHAIYHYDTELLKEFPYERKLKGAA